MLAPLMAPSIAARLASWPAPCPVPQLLGRIRAMQAAQSVGLGMALVMADAQDTPFGWVSAEVPPGERGFALITYWLGEAWQGRGLMGRAANQAVSLFFDTLPIPALRAAVQLDNGRSRSLLQQLGAHLVGPGRIWCPSRSCEEACLYYELPRP